MKEHISSYKYIQLKKITAVAILIKVPWIIYQPKYYI